MNRIHDDWICNLNRKKQQRKINKLVRNMNKNIENDNLWKGRFYCHQVYSPQWYIYEDKSGAELFVHLEFVDKQTGKTMLAADTVSCWCHWGGIRLFRAMNDFIVNYCAVWEETPRPHETTSIDYRGKNK